MYLPTGGEPCGKKRDCGRRFSRVRMYSFITAIEDCTAQSGGHPPEEAERFDKDDCDAANETTHKRSARKRKRRTDRSQRSCGTRAVRVDKAQAESARMTKRIADLGSPLLAAGCWEAEPWTARSRPRKGPAPQGAKQGSHGGRRRKPESVTAGNRLGRGPRSAKRRGPQGRRPKCQERRSEPD